MKVLCFLILFYPTSSFCIFGDILRISQKAVDTALILDSIDDLLREIGSGKEVSEDLKSLNKELLDLRKEVKDYEHLGYEVKRLMNPDRVKGLKRKLRYTADYMRRVKRVKSRILGKTLVSASAVTATEQMRTNQNLAQMLKNYDQKLIQEEREKLSKIREDLRNEKEEREFLRQELKKINKHSSYTGLGVFHPFKRKDKS